MYNILINILHVINESRIRSDQIEMSCKSSKCTLNMSAVLSLLKGDLVNLQQEADCFRFLYQSICYLFHT